MAGWRDGGTRPKDQGGGLFLRLSRIALRSWACPTGTGPFEFPGGGLCPTTTALLPAHAGSREGSVTVIRRSASPRPQCIRAQPEGVRAGRRRRREGEKAGQRDKIEGRSPKSQDPSPRTRTRKTARRRDGERARGRDKTKDPGFEISDLRFQIKDQDQK